ncbi:unnamed protein product [Prorocentrum cordatum]|uniref:Beta-galactosidase n=1 Tax=Prorocentrum cordatum TaxID=2364126 RepID=A0ABN9YJE7_9DINO|nr:unnamed protein product [Polarella glacialis]
MRAGVAAVCALELLGAGLAWRLGPAQAALAAAAGCACFAAVTAAAGGIDQSSSSTRRAGRRSRPEFGPASRMLDSFDGRWRRSSSGDASWLAYSPTNSCSKDLLTGCFVWVIRENGFCCFARAPYLRPLAAHHDHGGARRQNVSAPAHRWRSSPLCGCGPSELGRRWRQRPRQHLPHPPQ